MQSKTTFNKLRRVFKLTALALCFFSLFTGLANAQTYVNSNLSTGAISSNSVAAPAGTTWSEVQLGNTNAGFNAAITANAFRLGDDFVVPAGPAWNITSMRFYGYQTGYTGIASPFTTIRITIHSGSITGPVVFGNQIANRFAGSAFANMYRIFNATPGQTRRIWSIDANVSVTLAPGTYWIEYATDVTGGAGHFLPNGTVAGQVSQPGNNAQSLTVATNTWAPALDGVNPQDMPFSISYNTGPCAGTPTPGNTLTTAAAVCPSTPFTVSLQNATAGSGVTYQWFSGPTAAGPFTPIAGATNNSYLVAAITATTFYRATVTCSGNVGTSTAVQVIANPTSACYCIPAPSDCTDDDVILNVKLGNLNKTSTCAPNGYVNYVGTDTATIISGAMNPISVTTGDSWTEQVGVWIDYDRSGSFEASEFTNLGATAAGSGGIHNGVISVPGAVALGYTRMRVRVRFSTALTGTNACLAYAFGETEDYTVNIIPCVPATITAQPTNATAVCGASTSFSVTVGGSIPVVYWQFRSNASVPWQDVTAAAPYSGAKTSTLTISPATTGLNGYQYRAVFSGACTGADFSNPATLTVNALVPLVTPTSATICLGSIQELSLTNSLGDVTAWTEGFNGATVPTGWATQNNSNPAGPTGWFPGTPATFPAFSGAGYIAANFQSTDPSGSGSISNWLISPVQNLKNGDLLTFYSRIPAGGEFPDRLEVRLSSAGASSNVGNTSTSVGDFSTLLLSINPTLITGVYPKVWTKFTATITGLSAPTTGKVAFRYFVTDGGGTGANSNYIGIDEVAYVSVGAVAQGTWTSTRTGTIFTDAAATTPYTGTPATTVFVKPDTLGVVNYSVSFATPSCQSIVTTVPVTVRSLPTTFTAPVNRVICQGATTTFTSAATNGNASSTVWQVSSDNGATYTNIANGGVYSGATTNTLTITGAGVAINANRYRLSASAVPCTGTSNSAAASLTVNPTPAIVLTANPFTAIYPGQTTTLSAAVSPNAAATYTWFRDGVVVAGAGANTLVVDIDKLGVYTVRVSDVNGCTSISAGVNITAAANDLLFIYPSPNTGQFQVRFFSQLGSAPFPRTVSVFDSKGSRVFTKTFAVTSAFTRMDVDLKNYSKGIYSVELTDSRGNRLKTGRVLVL